MLEAPRVTSVCVPGIYQLVNPSGGLAVSASCGGYTGIFYYGANNAPAHAYNLVTTSVTTPPSAIDAGGLPPLPYNQNPLAYFEFVGIGSSLSVTYGPPSSDHSLIVSTSITKGAQYLIVGYEYVPGNGPSAGVNPVYQSAVYTAKYAGLLSIASPLYGLTQSGQTMAQLTHYFFVLVSISNASPTPSPTASPSPVPAGQVSEFPITTTASKPYGIASGPDGNLWFTESAGNKIGQLTTLGTLVEFPIPTSNSAPHGITAGPDGALWFVENSGNKIGRITTSGAITEYSTGLTANSGPEGIVAGPDGALWFTENTVSKIGRITTSGAISEYALSTAGKPTAIVTDTSDGALWFTEYAGAKVGMITTTGVISNEYAVRSNSAPRGIAAGSDGNLWYTEQSSSSGNRIGRISTTGTISDFGPLATANSQPYSIAAGPDENLWFTEYNNDTIGRISVSGTITEYAIPTASSAPLGIAAGPDGALWFTEYSGNKIGRITTGLTANLKRHYKALPAGRRHANRRVSKPGGRLP
jgi:streptogramin lyase